MVVISFSIFKDKIESGEKDQTIRPYSPIRYKQLKSAKIYHLWWHNPRNHGTPIFEVLPLEPPFLISFNKSLYYPNIDRIGRSKEHIDLTAFARRDGFASSQEMFDWLEENYGNELYRKRFIVVRWIPPTNLNNL